MKLINTGKKKVVAGAVTLALVTGTGFGVANTDFGAQLKDWYNGQFNVAVKDSESDAAAYAKSKLPELQSEYNGIKSGAVTDINTQGTAETDRVSNEIELAKDSHLSNLTNAEKSIMDEAELRFYKVFLEGTKDIQNLAALGEEYATKELKGLTKSTGESAVSSVNEDLEEAKKQALTELEDSVKAAKENLQNDLNDRSENLTYNLKQQIDFSIKDLRESIEGTTNDLVEAQKIAITEAANAKGTEAIDALNAVSVN